MRKFALIGVAGFIAPRHLKAIYETGNKLVAATDPQDSVGILDNYFPEALYFKEIERFDRFLEKLRRKEEGVDFISICTPNYLHDAHIRLALRLHSNAICEKPLVINPWNLDFLEKLEKEYKKRVYTILQLRVHPEILKLKEKLKGEKNKHNVILTYITPRGQWYQISWKGDEEKSGGLAMNIGVHFFDLLLWLFGNVGKIEVHHFDKNKISGFLDFERAKVSYFLSIDKKDMPENAVKEGKKSYRSIEIDGEVVEFSEGFADLHTKVYEEILKGKGFGIGDSRPSIELVYKIRKADVNENKENLHPWLR